LSNYIMLFLFLSTFIYAQINHSGGNIVHFNVDDDTVGLSDTLGSWVNNFNDHRSNYYDVIRNDHG